MSQLTLDRWRKSIICLGYEINRLYSTHNLLPDSATERREFFFSDSTVPLPRPCTALAWASLCAFGPIQGYIQASQAIPFEVTRGRFLLPFLPKLLYDEDTSQSLIRSSRAHSKDIDGNIRWGQVFIGDSSTGEVIEQLPHGQLIAREWADDRPADSLLNRYVGQSPIPPLYSTSVDGWQFGIIQNLSSQSLTLRDPMIELARHGIPELIFGGRASPRVKRLLIRFLNVHDARAWAKAYAEAMTYAFNEEKIDEDVERMNNQVQEHIKQQIIDATKESKKKEPAYKRSVFAKEGFFDGLVGLMKAGE